MNAKLYQPGLIFLLIIGLVISLSNVYYAQQIDNSEEIAKLKEQISKLETKVNEQWETISKLQKEISELKVKTPLLAVPKPNGKKSLPKGSREFYFNGQVYYMVPLDGKIKLIEDDKQKIEE